MTSAGIEPSASSPPDEKRRVDELAFKESSDAISGRAKLKEPGQITTGGLTDPVFILGPSERYGALGVPVLPDQVSSQGPLSAIYTALDSSRTALNLFLACDMPLMQLRFLKLLVERTRRVDAVLMRFEDGSLEPLCAVYHCSCLAAVQANFEKQRFKLSDLLAELTVAYITETDLRHLSGKPRLMSPRHCANPLLQGRFNKIPLLGEAGPLRGGQGWVH